MNTFYIEARQNGKLFLQAVGRHAALHSFSGSLMQSLQGHGLPILKWYGMSSYNL
jgi:hypothetical protein